jgi:hypothetical protein
MTRKFRELFLAYKISKKMSKQDILAGYLNTIYFGHGAYGVQAASKEYFDIDAKKLTVSRRPRSFATVVNNPSMYDPSRKDNRRASSVLPLCPPFDGRDGDITPYRTASTPRSCRNSPRSANQRYGGPKGFLLRWSSVSWRAALRLFPDQRRRPERSPPPFDQGRAGRSRRRAQKYTRQSAGPSAASRPRLHAALASVDVNTGEVLALYGGPDFVKNSANWATTPRPDRLDIQDLRARRRPEGRLQPVRHVQRQYLDSRRATRTRSATSSATSTANRSTWSRPPPTRSTPRFVDLTTQMDNGRARS